MDKILAQAESESAPATELTDEYDVVHRLWVVWQPERIDAIHRAMASQKLVIADGHHRYETALNYRNERRKENAREQGSSRDPPKHTTRRRQIRRLRRLAASSDAAARQQPLPQPNTSKALPHRLRPRRAASLAAGSAPQTLRYVHRIRAV